MKDKKLNAELKKLMEDLGKDLWPHQSAVTRYLYYILMESSKVGIAIGVLGIITMLGMIICLSYKPEWLFPLICIQVLLHGVTLRLSITVLMKWHKFPKTGKMPNFDEPWKAEE